MYEVILMVSVTVYHNTQMKQSVQSWITTFVSKKTAQNNCYYMYVVKVFDITVTLPKRNGKAARKLQMW